MPAALAVRCPECEKGLKLKPSAAGKRVKCPDCGAAVKVPAGGAAPAKAKAGVKAGGGGDFFSALPKAKAPAALPGRVGAGGPSTSEMPVYDGGPKKKAKEPTSPVVIAASLGGGLLVLLAAAGGLGYLLYASRPIEAPTEFAAFEHPAPRAFALDVPAGWETKTGGGQGGTPAWATFSGPGGEFDVRASRRGSAMGDIANAGGGGDFVVGQDLPEEETAIFKQHAFTKDQTAADYQTYTETSGENFDPQRGEGRVSEFTGTGTFGGTTRGLRATVRLGTETYNVVAKTSQKTLPGDERRVSGNAREFAVIFTRLTARSVSEGPRRARAGGVRRVPR